MRRVRKFQIGRSSKSFKELDRLCFLSKNMYNYTLHILKMLWLASDANAKHPSEFYLDQIPEEVKKFVTKTTVTKTDKKTGEKKNIDRYFVSVGTSNGKSLTNEKAFYVIFKEMNQSDYRSMYASAARGAVKLAYKAYKAYKAAIADYYKNEEKYTGRPEFPGYKGDYRLERKNGRTVFSIDDFRVSKYDGMVTINGDCELDSVFVDKSLGKVKQIRVIPRPSMDIFVVELIYEFDVRADYHGENVMGIDIGINNLATITVSDRNGNVIDTVIINGKPLKSINQFYNKEVARLNHTYQESGNTYVKKDKDGKDVVCMKSGKKRRMLERKRHNKIETYMHQSSKMVIDIAKRHGVGRIFIGYNPEWKQNCNIGKVNNQNFVQIPHRKFIECVSYKGNFEGIEVTESEESYTSKCSAIDGEEICHHDTYVGRRGGRHNKDFVTGGGILINADVNGSLNILRKGLNTLTEGKTRNVNVNQTVFAPMKLNVGRKLTENAVQNSSDENPGNMSGEGFVNQSSLLKQEATVDSRNDEKSPFKKNFDEICRT